MTRRWTRVVLLMVGGLSGLTVSATAEARGNHTIQSFQTAKRASATVFRGQETTFYCGCPYTGNAVDLPACGYVPQSTAKRAKRLEGEHVVPAENFGRAFPEWWEGRPACVDRRGKSFTGRNCARKVSIPFRLMESDLYNLQPAIGEVNGRRSNYRMAMIPGEQRAFGRCDVEIAERRMEPRPAIRGDIARTSFYMEWAYGRRLISAAARQLFEVWDKTDPVDAWERERARRIQAIQGNANPFIK